MYPPPGESHMGNVPHIARCKSRCPAYERGRSRTDRSIFDSRVKKSPRLYVDKLGWPKGVPRIANLADEPRRPKSSAKNRKLLLQPIVMPRMIAAMAQGR